MAKLLAQTLEVKGAQGVRAETTGLKVLLLRHVGGLGEQV